MHKSFDQAIKNQSLRPLEVEWNKSSVGCLKCNIDASFADNKAGIGYCIRDDKSWFIVAQTEWFSLLSMYMYGKPWAC